MGLFDSVLGPSFLGLSGSESKQTTQLDPTTKALNTFRLNSLTDPNSTLSQYLQNMQGYRNLSPETQGLLSRATGYAGQTGPNAGDWYGRTRGDLDYTGVAGNGQNAYGNYASGMSTYFGNAGNDLSQYYQNAGSNLGQGYSGLGSQLQGDYGQLGQNLNQFYQNAGATLSGFQQPQFGRASAGWFNPNTSTAGLENQLLKAGGDYYSQILGPQVGSQNALMGLARSGANTEAQARAATSISLPIAQQLTDIKNQLQQQGNTLGTQQQMGLNQFNLSQEQGLNQLYAGLTQQQRQLIAANLAQAGGAMQGVGQAGLQSQQQLGQYGLDAQQAMLAQGGAARQGMYGQLGSQLGQGGLQNMGYQQQLGSQYLQNLYGLNQQYPGVDINYINSQLGRYGQGIDWSDYARQSAAGIEGQGMGGYLSAFNATPYTPGGTMSKTGNEGLLNTAFGQGVGQGLGSAAKSDRKDKDGLTKFSSKRFLNKLKAYTYIYKEPEKDGYGSQVGILAQDLEKTAYGKKFVELINGSKYIDYTKMLPLLMACLVDLNSRIGELERG